MILFTLKACVAVAAQIFLPSVDPVSCLGLKIPTSHVTLSINNIFISNNKKKLAKGEKVPESRLNCKVCKIGL